jgi:uncharacterized protein (TIGR02391 family)
VAANVPLPFADAHLEQLCRELAETASGAQLTRLLHEARVDDPTGEGTTKWRRLHVALADRQAQDGHAGAVCRFISITMAPVRFSDDPEGFEVRRERLNIRLGFAGLRLREDGKVAWTPSTKTLPEAQARANALHAKLKERNVHPDVLRFCRAELVQQNYFHAVFEATKSVADKVRTLSGLSGDGAQLIDAAFGVKGGMPPLAFNMLRTEPERSEQTGLAMLIKGMFGTFRNTTGHAPKIAWPIDLDDALDLLTLASMIHRRLDSCHVTPAAPSYRP